MRLELLKAGYRHASVVASQIINDISNLRLILI